LRSTHPGRSRDLVRVCPWPLDSEVAVLRVLLDQELEDLPDLPRGAVVLGELAHEFGVVLELVRRRVRPVNVVEDQPATRAKQLVDQEEGEAGRVPGVAAGQIRQVETRPVSIL